MKARKPRGFTTNRAVPAPGQENVTAGKARAGTLEGLEGNRLGPARRPRSKSVTRAQQLEGLEERAKRANAEPFMREQLANVSDANHPLHNLVQESATKPGTHEWHTTERVTAKGEVQRGRYPGSETHPIVQAGHEEAYAAGGEQRFMLEDADMNISSGAGIESKGAYSVKERLLVTLPDGTKPVWVEAESLKQWERMGVVPEGTTARAIERTAAENAAHAPK
jgi:hypothetical protein